MIARIHLGGVIGRRATRLLGFRSRQFRCGGGNLGRQMSTFQTSPVTFQRRVSASLLSKHCPPVPWNRHRWYSTEGKEQNVREQEAQESQRLAAAKAEQEQLLKQEKEQKERQEREEQKRKEHEERKHHRRRGRKPLGRLVKLGLAAWIVAAGAGFADIYRSYALRGEDVLQKEPWLSLVVQLAPTRLGSRLWGMVHEVVLPVPLRAPLYRLWTVLFDCKLDEMMEPDLDSYPNLKSFFVRRLKEGVRPMARGDLVSPVDAQCTVIGEVTPDMKLEQIKGQTYDLSKFLGIDDIPRKKGKKLYHCVLYLAPGDYHRIHSACDWTIAHRTHFAGECMPVAPAIVDKIPWLFTRNERVVLHGEWRHGFFSLSSVAAYNVGNIKLNLVNDDTLVTNCTGQRGIVYNKWLFNWLPKIAKKHIFCQTDDLPWSDGNVPPSADPIVATSAYPKAYLPPVTSSKGDEIARFELGSTVVLVFEADECEFLVKPGQKVVLGQQLANIK